MFKIAVIALAFGLTGCYQRVNNVDLAKAQFICGGLDKVEYIDAMSSGDEIVKCTTLEGTVGLGKVVLPRQ